MDSKNFPISTYVASLFKENDEDIGVFQEQVSYYIPIYQRPYSWDEEHVSKFLETLLEDFSPNDNKTIFFGTMQYNTDGNVKDIVDGQQRMTTFVLFLTLLRSLSEDKIENFENRIGIQNSELKDAIDSKSELKNVTFKKGKNYYEIPNGINKYKANYILLSILFKEYFNDSKDSLEQYSITNLQEYAIQVYKYIVERVYFVVMETEKKKMPLAEIVKVFNTINTTGMDLNASDIFKLKFYDYHRQACTNKDISDEALMKEIDACFDFLKNTNIEMSYVLDIYKHILCSAPEKPLGFANLKKSNEAFFDWLFKNLPLCNELESYLSIKSFKNLVLLTVNLYDYSHNKVESGMYSLSELIISETRYSRYWTVPYVYSFFKLKDKIIQELRENDLIKTYDDSMKAAYSAAKYFICYSVVYDKVVNHVQNEICSKFLPSLKTDEIYNLVVEEWVPEEFKKRMIFDLKNNDKRAYIVCLFSAIIDEVSRATSISDIRQKLFNWNENQFDIEHIEAVNNWKDNQNKEECSRFNGIGNLVVLERRINRDIKDKPVEKKIEYYKGQVEGKIKKGSCFVSVNNVCDLFKEKQGWSIDVVELRANMEVKKISDMLF